MTRRLRLLKLQNITPFLLAALLIAACGRATPSPAPTATATATPPPTDTPTQTVTSSPSPTATPSNTPPTPADNDPNCLPPGDPAPLGESSFEGYLNSIADFLNAGGTAEALRANLEALGISQTEPTVATQDLTGDGLHEVVVALIDRESAAMPPGGALLIYACQGGHFELAHVELPAESYGAPRIVHLGDLNADGLSELVTSSSQCGAHTCFEALQILNWDGDHFLNRLEGSTADLPYPQAQLVDSDHDGVYDLEVTGTGVGSVGAGPQREHTRAWHYSPDSGMWIPGEETVGPSNFRIHTLHDADQAARNGDYALAISLYDQVINSDELEDWYDPENQRLNLGAYARFKLVVVNTAIGDLVQAIEVFQEMLGTYPEDSPQRAYVEMADAFLDAYATDGFEAGCVAAQDYAQQHSAQVLTPLGQETFGYANPDYTPEDMCP